MDPFTLALGWLAQRELSERQIRTRLARREVDPEEIDEAVARLKGSGALNDERVAGAYVRTAVRLKGRGPMRLRRDLALLGIDRAAAGRAVAEALVETPEETLVERALDKRWPRTGTVDRRVLARLHRALLRQGFASDKVMAALQRRHRERPDD